MFLKTIEKISDETTIDDLSTQIVKIYQHINNNKNILSKSDIQERLKACSKKRIFIFKDIKNIKG